MGIVFGLGTYGHKVMATVGENIAADILAGFTAQISTALTVDGDPIGIECSNHPLFDRCHYWGRGRGPDKINKATIKKLL